MPTSTTTVRTAINRTRPPRDIESATLVDLDQLAENIHETQAKLDRGNQLLFSIKTDAYGHGIVPVAKVAQREGVDYLGVANLEEGLKIRNAGIRLPVLIFTPQLSRNVSTAIEHDLSLTVTKMQYAKQINEMTLKAGREAKIHLKVDTGMGRLGMEPAMINPTITKCRDLSHLKVEGVYSHLSCSDSTDNKDVAFTRDQLRTFRKVLHQLKSQNQLPPLRHISNSGALLQYLNEVTEPPLNMVRSGTLLYGFPEVDSSWATETNINPVMKVVSNVVDLNSHSAGSYISYDRTYKCSQQTTTAILPLGYAHGLDRRLSNVGKVRVNNSRASIIGKICADKTIVDVSGMNVQIGDKVEVMGTKPNIQQLARRIDASVVELLTGLDLERFYV